MQDDITEGTPDRQRRKRTENSSSRERIPGSSPREHARRDDFAHYPRPKSPVPTDSFDSIGRHRLGNRSPIAKSAQSSTEFNGSAYQPIYVKQSG